MNYHDTIRVYGPDRHWAKIDRGIAPLIKALWLAGYETIGSCENLGESASGGRGYGRKFDYWDGYVLIEMSITDACRLLDAVKDTPQFQNRMHWTDPGAWEISVPVLPFGWDGYAQESPWAQIRFPNDQIDDLIKVIEAG